MLNAAAYTAVDAAETPEGRRTAWAANAGAPATLARLAAEHRFTLVHYSTEYVFDGTVDPHTEDEPLSPSGSTRRPRRPATSRSPPRPATTCCAPRG